MKKNLLRAFAFYITVGLCSAHAQVGSTNLPAFFDRISPSVVEVELRKPADNRRHSKGSGFMAGSNRWVVTNFHVIDSVAFETIEGVELWVNGVNGFQTPAKVVLVDIWNDLALLQIDKALPSELLKIDPAVPLRGERGYVFGSQLKNHSILAEGVFNGIDDREEDAPALIFIGPVSTGMSGGPVLDMNGIVRGVSHMTLENKQLMSLMVPSEAVAQLLLKANEMPPNPKLVDRAELSRQVVEVTKRYSETFLGEKLVTQDRGRFTLPTKACETFEHHDYGDDHTGKDSLCRIGFSMPITSAPEAGYGFLKVLWLQTPDLSFFKRRSFIDTQYQELFENKDTDPHEFMGDWDCETTEARPITGTKMRVEFCERSLDTLDGVSHFAARGVSLNGGSEHALFSFFLEGYSQENAKRILDAVLEKISFRP
jgi:S1-C subfamily serine protease